MFKFGSMKLAITGSRNFDNIEFMMESLSSVMEKLGEANKILEVWAGGAKGADALAVEAARRLGLPFHEIKADWAIYGRAAGPMRNKALVEECDVLVAFPIGESKGTRGCIQLGRKAGRKVFVFESQS